MIVLMGDLQLQSLKLYKPWVNINVLVQKYITLNRKEIIHNLNYETSCWER